MSGNPDIERLSEYPKIKWTVETLWHTVELKKYIDRLFGDTRDGQRQGFPINVSEALLNISRENIAYLESIGIEFDDATNPDFCPTGWEIPRNF